jgi:hypothetical protein
MDAETTLKELNKKLRYERDREQGFALLDQIDGLERLLKKSLEINEDALRLLRTAGLGEEVS